MIYARIAAVAVVVLGLAGGGYWLGARVVQGRWDAADRARERAEAERAAEHRRAANTAAAGFEAGRRRLASIAPAARAAVGVGLRLPIQCPSGEPVVLGDLRVPAAVIDGLRRAGGDAAP